MYRINAAMKINYIFTKLSKYQFAKTRDGLRPCYIIFTMPELLLVRPVGTDGRTFPRRV